VATEPKEVLVEAIVATVDQAVITLSEVESEARIILIRRGGVRGASGSIDNSLRAAVLQYLVNQEVILNEARRLQMFQVNDEELERELEQVRRQFATKQQFDQFLIDNGLTQDDIAEIIRRDLRVAKFLRSRVQMMTRMDSVELRAYYDEHHSEFADMSFAQARGLIEERLGRDRHDKAIRAWVEELKQRANIRLLRSFTVESEP
jgi:hypothetical protein